MHNKTSWNILFVTMILLIVSSMMWLLIVYYMKAMIWLTWNFHDYFQAYYHANAWVEIWLTQIVARQSYWFEKDETSFSQIFDSQVDSAWKKVFPSIQNIPIQSNKNNTTWSIISFGTIYADDFVYWKNESCDWLQFKNLSQWEPILIPLYYDDKWSNTPNFKQVEINDFKSDGAWSLKLSIIASWTVKWKIIEGEIDWDFLVKSSESSIEYTILNNQYTDIPVKNTTSNFVAFLKTNEEAWSVCIKFNNKVPLPFYLVSSTSTYWRTRIVLQWYKKNERIWEFLYTAIASNQ